MSPSMARYVSGRVRLQIRPMSPSGARTVPSAQPCEMPWLTRTRQTCSANDGSGCDGSVASSRRDAAVAGTTEDYSDSDLKLLRS